MINEQNIKSFFAKMARSDELAQAGFKLLEARDNPIDYFPYAMESGQFALEKFKPPQKADREGFFWMPSHSGLGYLRLVAKHAVEKNDHQIIRQILDLIKRVSRHKPEGAAQLDNYYIWRSFLEIVSLIPVSYYDDELIQLVDVWLSSRFDRGLVASELADGLLIKLAKAQKGQSAKWACDILKFSTNFGVVTKKLATNEYRDIEGVVDPYWLRDLFKKTAPTLAMFVGRPAIDVMLDRLLQVRKEGKLEPSSWYRSAIEPHEQNRRENDYEDILVTATRDILLTWVQHNPVFAKPLFDELMRSDYGLFKRFALFLATEISSVYDQEVIAQIDALLPNIDCHHEIYRFLNTRFSQLEDRQKGTVLAAIQNLQTKDQHEDPELSLAYAQLTWLSAIFKKGSETVDIAKAQLEAAWPKIKLSKHPDFLSWMETRHGPGPSPLSESEIVSLAATSDLVTKLNEFEESPNAWLDEPTIRALSETLKHAIKTHPRVFSGILDQFSKAKYAYKYSVLAAFHDLRREAKTSDDHEPWAIYWPNLINFSRDVLGEENFWEASDKEASGGVAEPTKAWIPGQIVDLLRQGLDDDAHPIPSKLLGAVGQIIIDVLENADSDDKEHADQLNHAINTTKGRAFEAFMAYALSHARKVSSDGRADEWKKHQAVFDRLLEECSDRNFDISALLGQYQSQFMFLSENWIEANFSKIFPYDHFPRNFRAACSGLAYCRGADRKIFKLLRATGALIAAIRDPNLKGHAREVIFQRLGLAIMWGDEAPNGEVILAAIQAELVDDIAGLVSFISRVSDQVIEAKVRRNVIALWSTLSLWADESDQRSAVSSALVGLIEYVDVLNDETVKLAKAAIVKADDSYLVMGFAESLLRLYPSFPTQTVDLLMMTVKKNIAYDHEDTLRKLVLMISERFPQQAIAAATELRFVPSMSDLIARIRAQVSTDTEPPAPHTQ